MYIKMCINFRITVRVLQNNERGFTLIFAIAVAITVVEFSTTARTIFSYLSSVTITANLDLFLALMAFGSEGSFNVLHLLRYETSVYSGVVSYEARKHVLPHRCRKNEII
jgi:hypothetical protein